MAESQNNKELPTKLDYQNAIYVQSACNLSGVVHSLSEVLPRIWNEARTSGGGTANVNEHPIVRLYAEQITHLSRGLDYFDASARVDRAIEAMEQHEQQKQAVAS